MRDESRTEAEAARAAAILGRHEYIGGGAEVNVPTPVDTDCVWCQGGEGDHWHAICWAEAHDYFDVMEVR